MLLYNGEHELNWYHISARGLKKKNDNWTRIIGTIENIQEKKETEEQHMKRESELIKLSKLDSMTNVLNRYGLEKEMNKVHCQQGDCMCALVDIDDFKRFNDIYGHLFGDEVLKYIAGALQQACHKDDLVGRIGGDEFFILFRDTASEDMLKQRLIKIMKTIAAGSEQLSVPIPVTVSIGAVIIQDLKVSFNDVYRRADLALYGAKNRGKNLFLIYTINKDNSTVIDDEIKEIFKY